MEQLWVGCIYHTIQTITFDSDSAGTDHETSEWMGMHDIIDNILHCQYGSDNASIASVGDFLSQIEMTTA